MKKAFIVLLLGFLVNCFAQECPYYARWWIDRTQPKNVDFLMRFYGGITSISRVAFRSYLKTSNYQTMLDIPCGFGTEYVGLINDKIFVEYQGLDIAPYLLEYGKEHNIPIDTASIEAIPYQDNSFDICFSRHLFEHMPTYEKAIAELVRVAKYEVIIVFSITPGNQPDRLRQLYPGLYVNEFNKARMEEYIRSIKKVERIVWVSLGIESMLHIYLH